MNDFNLSDYLVANKDNKEDYPMVPRIRCADGFHMSVQCNSANYCKPREDRSDFYYMVEVGFPSSKPELIMNYAENSDKPTKSIYGYVPIELVQELIELHGGVAK